jgi:hypothetical protein
VYSSPTGLISAFRSLPSNSLTLSMIFIRPPPVRFQHRGPVGFHLGLRRSLIHLDSQFRENSLRLIMHPLQLPISSNRY